MFRYIAIAGLITGLTSTAAAAPCDVMYEVQADDKLSEISQAAYGFGNYQLIYSRNLAVLPSLSDLPVGQNLVIPCQPGELGLSPDAVALTFRMLPLEAFTSIAPEAAVAAAPVEGGLSMLAADGESVLADKALAEGGMIPAIIRRALEATRGEPTPLNLSFVADKKEHVRTLMPFGDYRLSFPWRKPVCDQPGVLSADEAVLCKGYSFSLPLYEEVVGVFGSSDDARAAGRDHAVLQDLRLCAPWSVGLGVLADHGLDLENVQLTRVTDLSLCFDQLGAGEADIVLGDIDVAGRVLAARDDRDAFAEAPGLAMISPVFAIALRNSADGMAALADLDAGLGRIKENGDWFGVVAAYLTAR